MTAHGKSQYTTWHGYYQEINLTNIVTTIQFSSIYSIYFKTHNIKKTSNTNTNNKSHGMNELQLRNVFWKGVPPGRHEVKHLYVSTPVNTFHKIISGNS